MSSSVTGIEESSLVVEVPVLLGLAENFFVGKLFVFLEDVVRKLKHGDSLGRHVFDVTPVDEHRRRLQEAFSLEVKAVRSPPYTISIRSDVVVDATIRLTIIKKGEKTLLTYQRHLH